MKGYSTFIFSCSIIKQQLYTCSGENIDTRDFFRQIFINQFWQILLDEVFDISIVVNFRNLEDFFYVIYREDISDIISSRLEESVFFLLEIHDRFLDILVDNSSQDTESTLCSSLYIIHSDETRNKFSGIFFIQIVNNIRKFLDIFNQWFDIEISFFANSIMNRNKNRYNVYFFCNFLKQFFTHDRLLYLL